MNNGRLDSFARNRWGFLVAVLLGTLAQVHTANAQALELLTSPYRATRTVTNASGALVNLTYQSYISGSTKIASNQAVYSMRAVQLSKATLGGLARKMIFSPWGVALSAAVTAAGYFIDEENQTVSTSGKLDGFPGMGSCASAYGNFGLSGNVSSGACIGAAISAVPGTWALRPGWPQADQDSYTVQWIRNGSIYQWTQWQVFASDSSQVMPSAEEQAAILGEPVTVAEPLADEDLWDAAEPYISPSSLTDALNDPALQPLVEYTEVANEIPGIDADLEAQYDDDPLTEPDPDDTPSTQNEPPLAFCDYATVICEFIEWVKEEPASAEPAAIPTEQVQVETWSSGLGAGSCPPDIVYSVAGTSYTVSTLPVCDFLGMMRYFLIAISYITAAFIIVGYKSG